MSLLAQKNPDAPVGSHEDSAAAFVPDQSRAERKTSYAVDDFAVPGGREEEWRFTPVDRLSALFQVAASETDKVSVEVQAPEGVTTSQVDPKSAGVLVPADRASAVAWAGEPQATQVSIPAEAELTEPVRITITARDLARVNGHLVIDAGHHSRATVVLTHRGSAECGANVELKVGDGADLTFVTVQEWDDESLHLTQNDALIGRDARLRHIAVTLGGKVVRVSTNARYSGPGGSFEGLGVYFADAGQHQEHRLFVDHEAPHCHSNVEYKGALQGDTAHTVWVGDVLIRASAEGTDTYELNRNLVLTEGGRADSIPNLEIETGEIVGAGHASATGRFDDEQLFYLMARGIPEDVARRLVVRGFFASIVARIGVPEVSEHLMEVIDAELGAVPGIAAIEDVA
ncbi:Fe-S cluster assembly protein SufD [Phycicoccus badiiscoriae]|uniref:Fe-S cluster assembly protein SufD n=1 Tax=Pedococcus badiiscoriae TaxID=642776 RepID=A0A852WGR6_9MICO|nr:Fe-S cluster assembly protein SufD [Pedococcus badiiscoriae]NYG08407.1 Fe-S cluster assembly protein SufD [Pedococcus badiiscoriae]